jgi:hypothetical protein
MDPNALRDHLAKLHAELAGADRLDAQSKQLLVQVAQDIRRLTDTPGADRGPPLDATLPDRLEASAIRFEAEHPALAVSVRKLVDLLGQAGI